MILSWLRVGWAFAGKWAPVVGKFAGKYWREILIVLLAWSWFHRGMALDRVEGRITSLRGHVERLVKTNAQNDLAIDQCRAVNDANSKARDQAVARAHEAEIRITDLAARLNAETEDVENEATDFMAGNDADCIVPDAFIDWLCVPGSHNCH